ncbi:MAG: phospholipase D-like domain-containing protein [Candidatus Margulisiibacteriota bacterium]|jgi:phosphatidylserine/phosphatidylglycerophosphate/cardiolipin synthase-like enzyme
MKKLAAVLLVVFFGTLGPTGAAPLSAEGISVYFSPNGGTRDKIISRINLARKSIKIAIYSLTSGEITWALENAKKRGVEIKVVADYSQSKGKHSEIPYLINKGFKVKVIKGKGRGIMHNKFAVFDDQEVATGSYNWTENAEQNNYENALFLKGTQIVSAFSREFDLLYDRP